MRDMATYECNVSDAIDLKSRLLKMHKTITDT
jgi:hypothetical protein